MTKDYIFLESTISICNECLKKVEAKIIRKKGGIYIKKFCPTHGVQEEILEENPNYYFKKNLYYKPGTGCKIQTTYNKGCPRDCGLCPHHEQHTCIGLVEITNKCDLGCPTCYANSGNGEFLDLETIEKMMDFYQDSEYNKADILQISGGEPTMHPQIIEILNLAKEKNFKYVMLNTNGLRIARDENFTKELGKIKLGFEIYLQFDGFKDESYKNLRGKNILDEKLQAIKYIQKYKIPTTLVSTIKSGLNDDEIYKIIEFGLNQDYIRGINFQPVAFFGRGNTDTKNRITLSGIIDEIENQSDDFIKFDDFIPLPCDPDRVALTYLHKKKDKWNPITHKIDVTKNLDSIKNTFAFDLKDIIEDKKDGDCCTGVCNPWAGLTKILEPKLILMSKQEQSDYVNNNFFRISIKSFIDVYNFDIKSVQKDCVHIITPDLKKIPFSTYNMFYRNK
ncbi:MAG: radical SAM protein [Candidatus Gracilibacteria bacterium]|nr:radical SAM protein [Candidatus Gracilibacteria bacterium]